MVPLCSGRLVVVKEQGRMRIGGCPLSDLYHHSMCLNEWVADHMEREQEVNVDGMKRIMP